MRFSRTHGRGHTLIELVTASVAASALLAGLASTVFIGREIAYTPVTSQKVLDSTNTLFELTDELRYALFIVERSANVIEFVVPDRTGDGIEDSIRYAWSGTSGDPLLRTFNHGTATTIAEDVEEFLLTDNSSQLTEQIETVIESAEVVLWQQAAASGADQFKLKDGLWCGQHLPPLAESAGIPADVIDWKLTKIQFEAKTGGKSKGQFAIQLRPAGSSGKPTSDVLGQVVVDEAELSNSPAWYEKIFSPAISGLSPHADYAVAYQWLADTDAAKFCTNLAGGSGLLTTNDSGATWTYGNPGEMSHGIFGTYTTPGTPIAFNHKWLERVEVSLQSGANAIGRVETSTQLVNRPEVTTEYRRADFDADPTLHDVDGDGNSDWAVNGGGAFNTISLLDGLWLIDDVLETNFDTTTSQVVRIAGRWRATSNGMYGPCLNVDLPMGVSTVSYFRVSANLMGDGTQTISVYDFDGSQYVSALAITGLDNGLHDIELTAFASRKLLRLLVDGVDYGVIPFAEHFGTLSQAKLTMAPDSTGEFDRITVSVSEETP